MRIAAVLIVGLSGLASSGAGMGSYRQAPKYVAGTVPRSASERSPLLPNPPADTEQPYLLSPCDPVLWSHVYHGKFPTAQDRLKVIQPCLTVTGVISSAEPETDGDYHIRLAVDDQFKTLLNDKNTSKEGGHLVVEPICEAPVTQTDAVQEGVCKNFKQTVFSLTMVGKHVSVTGAYVTDIEHGWNEIHPVSSIRVGQ